MNTFCLDCSSRGFFIGSYERDEEDAVVLEKGSGGVSWTDKSGADGVFAGAGVVRARERCQHGKGVRKEFL